VVTLRNANNSFLLIRGKASEMLLDRFRTLIDVDSVLSQLSRDTWHVGQFPSEDIFIVPEKIGEREFLCWRELSTDGRRLRGITSTQINLHDISFFWRNQDGWLFSR
jgi:hypothetical protein